MHLLRLIAYTAALCVATLSLSTCASASKQPAYSTECDISSLHSSDYPHDTWCHIKHAALRCSTKSDKCLVQCERRGGGKNIDGGCAHICSPGAYTEEDVIENGGEFYPPDAVACANEDV